MKNKKRFAFLIIAWMTFGTITLAYADEITPMEGVLIDEYEEVLNECIDACETATGISFSYDEGDIEDHNDWQEADKKLFDLYIRTRTAAYDTYADVALVEFEDEELVLDTVDYIFKNPYGDVSEALGDKYDLTECYLFVDGYNVKTEYSVEDKIDILYSLIEGRIDEEALSAYQDVETEPVTEAQQITETEDDEAQQITETEGEPTIITGLDAFNYSDKKDRFEATMKIEEYFDDSDSIGIQLIEKVIPELYTCSSVKYTEVSSISSNSSQDRYEMYSDEKGIYYYAFTIKGNLHAYDEYGMLMDTYRFESPASVSDEGDITIDWFKFTFSN